MTTRLGPQCCNFLKYCCVQMGLVDEKIDIKTANERLRLEAEDWDKANQSADINLRNSLVESHLKIAKPWPEVLQHLDILKPGTAVDLGCGNGRFAKCLLSLGWKVIAIDSSQKVVSDLHISLVKYIENGQLSLYCSKMENFEFPKNVQLIIAIDSLPYSDPKKINALLEKAYQSLAKHGQILGNFFEKRNKTCREIANAVGVWLTDKAVVTSLLDDKGFKARTWTYGLLGAPGPRNINFAAHKMR